MKRIFYILIFAVLICCFFGCKLDERPIKNEKGENVLESYIKKPIDKAKAVREGIESKTKNFKY